MHKNRNLPHIVILFSLILFIGAILCDPGFTQDNETEQNGKLISMSFREAELDNVLDFFSQATDYTIVKDADIKARVTIISQKDITTGQALSVINSILGLKGYASIVNGKILKIVPLDSAKQENTDIRVGSDPEQMESTDVIVTQIMPLSYADAAQIVKDMKDLIPKYGFMVAHTRSNAIIITASSSNIKRLAEIVKALDVPMSNLIKVEVFAIKYRDAETLAKVLQEMFREVKTSDDTAEQERAARGRNMRNFMQGRGGPDIPAEPAQTAASGESELLQTRGQVKVAADEDTNSIVVSASAENLILIKELIEKLDVKVTNQPETRVFKLEHADASELGDKLNSAFKSSSSSSRTSSQFSGFGRGFQRQPQETQASTEGGILGLPELSVVGDERTNSLIITTTSDQMESIGKLIEQLDTDIAEYEETTRIFSLENAKADDVASVLNSLFSTTAFEQQRSRTSSAGRGGAMGTAASTIETARGLSGNVKVVAEETTNVLLITSYSRNMPILEEIIKELDVMLPQVLIEVKIVEVTLNDESKFGVEWMWEQSTTMGSKTFAQNAASAFGLADEIFGLKYGILGENLEALLMSLDKNTNVNILSTPRILTVDNHEAIINISKEVPYLQSTQETNTGGVLTSYDYRDVGVILTVLPRINKSETVSLDVNQEINSLVEFTLFNAPVIAKREATASVTVKDKHTMIIGGIIEDNKTQTINKIPILGSIPFIGKLFRREETKTEKTELMVFITPHIIRSPEEAGQITEQQRIDIKIPSEAPTSKQ